MPARPGGTGSFVRYWRNHRVPVKVVPIATKPPSMLTGTEAFETDEGDPDDEFEVWVRASGRQEIKAIMFADVVGYSKLPETVIPKYVAQFNQRVSRLMAESSAAPVNVNTWGDGLFFVFNGVEDAGRFALDLRDLVIKTDWMDLGLPEAAQYSDRGPCRARLREFRSGRPRKFLSPALMSAARRGSSRSRTKAKCSRAKSSRRWRRPTNRRALVATWSARPQLAKSYGLFRVYSLERSAV